MQVPVTPSALAAGEAVRRLLAATDMMIRPAIAIAAIGSPGGEESHAQNPAEFAARFAGRTLPATVLEIRGDGSATVEIGGEKVQVAARLPDPGRTVMLRFAPAVAETRVTAGSAAAPPPAGVSVGALAQALSDTARAPALPLPLGAIDADPARPAAFADALAAKLRDSGMFYESHLARWTQGQYPVEQLRREPQTALPPVPPDAHADAARTDTAAAVAPGPHAGPQSDGRVAALPESLQPVLREQLQVLETRSLAVMIEPWPGQVARLEIRDEEDGNGGRQGSGEPAWSSRLCLSMPALGRVDADLSLAGSRLSLVIRADPDSADRMAHATGALGRALADAGITLAGCKVLDHA